VTRTEKRRKPGRPPLASTSRSVEVDKRTRSGKRLASIDKELLELSMGAAAGTVAATMRIADLQVQRWTLLSVDPGQNFREQREASTEAAKWTHEFRQLSQRQADDLIRELNKKMLEQEEAADRLERL
jgi:ribosomal protein L29